MHHAENNLEADESSTMLRGILSRISLFISETFCSEAFMTWRDISCLPAGGNDRQDCVSGYFETGLPSKKKSSKKLHVSRRRRRFRDSSALLHRSGNASI